LEISNVKLDELGQPSNLVNQPFDYDVYSHLC
jgi:hypothetical protein